MKWSGSILTTPEPARRGTLQQVVETNFDKKKSFEWWDTFSAGTGAVFTNCLGSATPAVARGRPQSSPGAANEWKFFFENIF